MRQRVQRRLISRIAPQVAPAVAVRLARLPRPWHLRNHAKKIVHIHHRHGHTLPVSRSHEIPHAGTIAGISRVSTAGDASRENHPLREHEERASIHRLHAHAPVVALLIAMPDHRTIVEAIKQGNIAAMEQYALMDKSFPTGTYDDPGTVCWIEEAIDHGTVEAVEWMLRQGAPVDFGLDRGNGSPLHAALERTDHARLGILQLLIEAGADLHERGIHDYTPAHLAACRNDVEALRILHQAGADFSLKTGIDEYATPRGEAIAMGRGPDAVEFLTSIGAP